MRRAAGSYRGSQDNLSTRRNSLYTRGQFNTPASYFHSEIHAPRTFTANTKKITRSAKVLGALTKSKFTFQTHKTQILCTLDKFVRNMGIDAKITRFYSR